MIEVTVLAVDETEEVSKGQITKPTLVFDTELDTYEMVNEWYQMGNFSSLKWFSEQTPFLSTMRHALPYFLLFKKQFGLGKFKKVSIGEQKEVGKIFQAGFS